MSDDEKIEALDKIRAHLGAAKMQRAPSDDKIIADHIDAAHAIACRALKSKAQS